jgi:hypothetical protein
MCRAAKRRRQWVQVIDPSCDRMSDHQELHVPNAALDSFRVQAIAMVSAGDPSTVEQIFWVQHGT